MPSSPMMSQSQNKTVLFVLYECVLLVPLILILWWIWGYMGGFDWSSDNSYKFNWHPVGMVLGFIVFFGNAIVAYRLLPFGIKTNKKIHAAFHLLATASIIFGMVAVIQNKFDQDYSQMYTSHSWMGATVLLLYIIQLVLSICIYQDFEPTLNRVLRRDYKSLHILLGIFIFFFAVITICVGVEEKAWYRVWSEDLSWSTYSTEGILINFIGISIILALLYTIYILYMVPKTIFASPRPGEEGVTREDAPFTPLEHTEAVADRFSPIDSTVSPDP